MMRGLWYYRDDYAKALELAKGMGTNTIIVKAAYHPDYPACVMPPRYIEGTNQRVKAAHDAGLLFCAEAYIVPKWAAMGGQLLKQAMGDGADSVMLNAEVEWENVNGEPPNDFLYGLGNAPLHLCSDIRGGRLAATYHQVLWPQIASVHPMVYHHAFRPGNPFGALQLAFDDTLGNPNLAKMPKSVPIYPVVQGYDGCDYQETLGAVILAHLYGCPGSSVYVSHDLNKRAELGVRDGWKIVEQLSSSLPASMRAAGGAAYTLAKCAGEDITAVINKLGIFLT